jgi:hypothetical protein
MGTTEYQGIAVLPRFKGTSSGEIHLMDRQAAGAGGPAGAATTAVKGEAEQPIAAPSSPFRAA